MPLNNKVAISVKRLQGKDISLTLYDGELGGDGYICGGKW